jgi:hypothetical protein
MMCPRCYNPALQTSELRVANILHLIMLMYPVRCRSCYNRFQIGLFSAQRLRNSLREAWH